MGISYALLGLQVASLNITANDLMIIKMLCICVGLGLVFFIAGILCYLLKVWLEERSKVKRMPKQPMTLCDVHGAYPSASTLKLTVPAEGRQDLVIEQCPQCYYDRLRSSKRIPA